MILSLFLVSDGYDYCTVYHLLTDDKICVIRVQVKKSCNVINPNAETSSSLGKFDLSPVSWSLCYES